MMKIDGLVLARLWGFSFAAGGALLAACSPAEVAPTSVNCRTGTGESSLASFAPVRPSASVDPGSQAFAAALHSRLSALTPEARMDVGARMNAVSGAIEDAAETGGASVSADQLHLRVMILLNADRRPDLMTQSAYQRLVDSVQRLPGVLAAVTRTRALINQGRALLASWHSDRQGESIFHPANDTVAATATLLEVQDAVSDTSGTLSTDFSTTTLGDGALADGLSSYAFDSTFSASLSGSTYVTEQLRPVVFNYLYAFWANGGSPQYSVSPACSTVTIGSGSGPANYEAWPGWLASGVVGGIINVGQGLITRLGNAERTAAMDVSEDLAGGLEFLGIDVAGDFAYGFIAGFFGDIFLVILFDVDHASVVVGNP